MQSHQQTVIEARNHLKTFRDAYHNDLKNFAMLAQQGKLTLQVFLDFQKTGADYFNEQENITAESNLLGAHKSEEWARTWAESCAATLEVIIKHFECLRKHQSKFNLSNPIEPTSTAYRSMQRSVKKYLPKEDVEKLKKKFRRHNLPDEGFNMKVAADADEKQFKFMLVIGIVGMLLAIFLSIQIPNPTKWQQITFRTLLGLSAASVSSWLPGFLNIRFKYDRVCFAASGALAMFIFLWKYNPPFV